MNASLGRNRSAAYSATRKKGAPGSGTLGRLEASRSLQRPRVDHEERPGREQPRERSFSS